MIFQRQQLPASLTQLINALSLEQKSVISWASHGGGYLIATKSALVSSDTHEATSTAWSEILSATWDQEVLTLITAQNQVRAWQLSEARDLPMVIRDFVTRTVVADRLVDISGVGPVRFVARRNGDGVDWLTITNANQNVETQSLISAELASIRSNLGI